jgi:hypothetical protein
VLRLQMLHSQTLRLQMLLRQAWPMLAGRGKVRQGLMALLHFLLATVANPLLPQLPPHLAPRHAAHMGLLPPLLTVLRAVAVSRIHFVLVWHAKVEGSCAQNDLRRRSHLEAANLLPAVAVA